MVKMNNIKLKINNKDMKVDIEYWDNGNIKSEFYNDGNHRTDGPAIILYYRSGIKQKEIYMVNSQLTKRCFYGTNGKKEQEDYWITIEDDNLPHREDGPAVIEYNIDGTIKSETYCYKGQDLPILKWMIIVGIKKGEQ